MASSPDKASVDPPSAEECNKKGEEKAAAGASFSTSAAADGAKKTVTVRMSQSQIDLFRSFKVEPVERDPLQCEEMDEIEAVIAKFEEELLEDQRMVNEQYEQKGYVEYEVDADMFPARAPPRPGRRRARSGVVVKKK